MDAADGLPVPTPAEAEARAAPVVARAAEAIGALAAGDGLVSPARFEKAVAVAEAVGALLGEPTLTRVLTLRALSSPTSPRAALAALRPAAEPRPAPERAALLREMAPLISGDTRPGIVALAPELAAALGVPLPEHLRQEGGGLLGAFADRARRLVRVEPALLTAARDFAAEFGEARLLAAVAEAQRSGDQAALAGALQAALDTVRSRAAGLSRATEAHAEALSVAQELDTAADRIEQTARQRYAAITRRAAMLKRHIRDELNTLVEDAAEEFEADFRRMSEKKKGWFGGIDTADLNERIVVKNLERRYRNLAARYQDQLDLLDREVSECCDEFTRVGDEALRPMARHEFRTVLPHPALEQRVKTAADRASTGALAAGAAGAVAGGAAVQTGLLTAGVVVGVAAAPVGAAVLGAVALAGLWKVFAAPGERRRRDLRDRARTLEEGLRTEILANLPRFETAVDAIVGRFRAAAVPDIAHPRIEAARIREIAASHRTIAQGVVEAANARIERLLTMVR